MMFVMYTWSTLCLNTVCTMLGLLRLWTPIPKINCGLQTWAPLPTMHSHFLIHSRWSSDHTHHRHLCLITVIVFKDCHAMLSWSMHPAWRAFWLHQALFLCLLIWFSCDFYLSYFTLFAKRLICAFSLILNLLWTVCYRVSYLRLHLVSVSILWHTNYINYILTSTYLHTL